MKNRIKKMCKMASRAFRGAVLFIGKQLCNAGLFIKACTILLLEFIARLLHDLLKLRWYQVAAIGPIFIRTYHPDSFDEIVPLFAKYHYTYYALWYYTLSRVMELFVFYSLYKADDNMGFLILANFAIGKIIDEGASPFNLPDSERLYWVVALVIVFNVWYRERNKR